MVGVLSLGGARVVWGQPSPVNGQAGQTQLDLGERTGTAAMSYPATAPGDIGVRLSESSVLHVGVSAEAGFDSNVFYSSSNPVQSAMTRVVPTFILTNADRQTSFGPTGNPVVAIEHSAPAAVMYSLSGSLEYREYLNSSDTVRSQRAFNPTLLGSLAFNTAQSLSLTLSDNFTRVVDPPYIESTDNITRDYNVGSAEVRFAPGGGRLTTTLRYTNFLDNYETARYKASSNMSHDLLLDQSWRWLPKTSLYLQGGVTVIHYLNADPSKHDSLSYRVLGGARGLVTAKVSALLGVGYSNASYDGGVAGPTGAATLAAMAGIGYRASETQNVTLSYVHGFRNSPVIGSFYDLDAVALNVDQTIARRLSLGVLGRFEYRRYHGFNVGTTAVNRNDNVVVGGAHLDFFVSRWFYAGIVYAMTLDSGTVTPAIPGVTGIDYVKHQLLGRLGVLY